MCIDFAEQCSYATVQLRTAVFSPPSLHPLLAPGYEARAAARLLLAIPNSFFKVINH